MKKILLLTLVFANFSFGGMTVKDYQEFKKDKNSLEWYFLGLGNGFAFSNTDLQSRGMTPLYCPPSDLKITKEMLLTMLDNRIKEFSLKEKDDRNLPKLLDLQIEPMLLSKLTELYPCNPKIKS